MQGLGFTVEIWDVVALRSPSLQLLRISASAAGVWTQTWSKAWHCQWVWTQKVSVGCSGSRWGLVESWNLRIEESKWTPDDSSLRSPTFLARGATKKQWPFHLHHHGLPLSYILRFYIYIYMYAVYAVYAMEYIGLLSRPTKWQTDTLRFCGSCPPSKRVWSLGTWPVWRWSSRSGVTRWSRWPFGWILTGCQVSLAKTLRNFVWKTSTWGSNDT